MIFKVAAVLIGDVHSVASKRNLRKPLEEKKMPSFSTALRLIERLSPAQRAYAHCDIPCGIYDPHQAQIATHTIVRMDMLIADLGDLSSADSQAKLTRYVAVKEEHAELAKKELRILWGDYFRPEHVEQYPNLHGLFFTAMKQGSQARQSVDIKTAQAFLATVQEIAEIFWKTKGAEPRRLPSRQTSGGEIVYPG